MSVQPRNTIEAAAKVSGLSVGKAVKRDLAAPHQKGGRAAEWELGPERPASIPRLPALLLLLVGGDVPARGSNRVHGPLVRKTDAKLLRCLLVTRFRRTAKELLGFQEQLGVPAH